jgi:hypothetical protein
MNLYYLTIAVIVLAVAQVLTILLTIGRDREIKQLRELITEQRIHIAELKAWISGRMQSGQSRRIKKPDREPIPGPTVPGPPKELRANTQQPAKEPETEEDASKRMTKVIRWFKEDADKAREVVAARHSKPPDEIE